MHATLYVVDGDPEVRESIGLLADSMGFQAAIFASGREFLEQYSAAQPGAIVLDLNLPDYDGLEILRLARGVYEHAQIVVTTASCRIPDVVAAMKQGAIDFLEKPCDYSVLCSTIGAAIERDASIRERQRSCELPENWAEELSHDQRQIVEMLCEGCTAKEIAANLDVSVRTVHYRKSDLLKKLRVESRQDLLQRIGVRRRPMMLPVSVPATPEPVAPVAVAPLPVSVSNPAIPAPMSPPAMVEQMSHAAMQETKPPVTIPPIVNESFGSPISTPQYSP
jgi:FixJ family two-component response regulator